MIENNIIKSLGAGSGIDSPNLIKQLTEIERMAPQKRIDDKKTLTETQISDFGLIKSSLATLQDVAKKLTAPEGLFSKSASFTDSDALVPSELGTDVLPGTYNFVVNDIAQSQSLSSAQFASLNDPVGEGTLTFRFGSWSGGAGGTDTFTEDLEQSLKEVVIDGTNNSLRGLRDAINSADFGVQASIVNDGGGYRLLITAASGVNNQLEISVAEAGGTPTNDDASGLSRFAFNDSDIPSGPGDTVHTQQMSQNQAGKDSSITINGMLVTRPTNTVSDVVDGLTVQLLEAAPTETVTVTVSEDKTFAEQNIRDFVTAYNTFLSEVDKVFGIDEETGKRGSLANDALAKSVLSQMRNVIAGAIPGLSGSNFTALTNVGIRTELDGTITIKETEFKAAFKNNFADIQKLFAPDTSSTVSDITVNSYGKQTVPGSYDVTITTNPTKGAYTGQAIDAGVTFPFDTTGKTYTFELSLNGANSTEITIPTGVVYNSGEEMAAAIQSLINAQSTFQTNNSSIVVSFNTDRFEFTSNKYGTSSTVNITAASADLATDLGITVGAGVPGVNVAGIVNGEVGFGLGNVLLPKLKSDAEGLTMVVGDNATSGKVSYSRGFGGEIESLIDKFLSSTGLIKNRESILTRNLESFKGEQESLDRRMSAFEERLIRQFIAMESIVGSLNTSGSFLDNLIDTLPFTAKK